MKKTTLDYDSENLKHPPLTLNVHIGHKAPGNRKKGKQSPGSCSTVAVGRGGACCHRDQVHGSDSASTEQKAAVQKEGLSKAHVIPEEIFKKVKIKTDLYNSYSKTRLNKTNIHNSTVFCCLGKKRCCFLCSLF